MKATGSSSSCSSVSLESFTQSLEETSREWHEMGEQMLEKKFRYLNMLGVKPSLTSDENKLHDKGIKE